MQLFRKLSSLKRASTTTSTSAAASDRHGGPQRSPSSHSSHRHNTAVPVCENHARQQESCSSYIDGLAAANSSRFSHTNRTLEPASSSLRDRNSGITHNSELATCLSAGVADSAVECPSFEPSSSPVSSSNPGTAVASSDTGAVLRGEREADGQENSGHTGVAELDARYEESSTVSLPVSAASDDEVPGVLTRERNALRETRQYLQNLSQVAGQWPRSTPPDDSSLRGCRTTYELRKIYSFSDLPDVCVRICFSFLSVEEILKYQFLSRYIRRAIGLDHVLPVGDAFASPTRPELIEPKSKTKCLLESRLPDADLDEVQWETPVESDSPSNCDTIACGDTVANSSTCSGALITPLSLGDDDEVSGQDVVADESCSFQGDSADILASKKTERCFSSGQTDYPGRDFNAERKPPERYMEIGRGATTCVFAFYRRLVVGITWLSAPPDVRTAYLSQFVGLTDLKVFFCPYADQSSKCCPTSWKDLWLLLQNNEKSLERLSLVSLPYEPRFFIKPKRSVPIETGHSHANSSRHGRPTATHVHRTARIPFRQSVSPASRDQVDSCGHTFVDGQFIQESRRTPAASRPTHSRVLYRGEGGSTRSVRTCPPHRPGTTMYLRALREFSIVGSATSGLVALDAMQPLLPHSLETFSLHGNLPRTLAGPLFGTGEGDRRGNSARAGSGGTGASSSRAFQGLGLHGAVRRLFGWPASENTDLDECDAVKENETQMMLRSLEGVREPSTWEMEVNREVLLRSVMMMHNLKVLDIRLPPALDRFSFRLVPSLVLMCTKLRQVTLDFRQLTELVDLSLLTTNVVTQPFGAGHESPSYRRRASTEQVDAGGAAGTGEAPVWRGLQTLLPSIKEVVLREPLHIGWAVEDVTRFMGVLFALPQCTIVASALVLHQHPLLGAVRPPGAVPDRGQTESRRGGDDLGNTDHGWLVNDEGEEASAQGNEQGDAEFDASTVGDTSRQSAGTATDSASDVGRQGEALSRMEEEESDDYGESSDRSHLEAEWEEGETGDGLLVGRTQYVPLLRQVIAHLAPNVCSLRVRYTSATTRDLPLSQISFPLLEELVLDNYCPDTHREIDKIVVPRTQTVTLGLNGHHLNPKRLQKLDRLNAGYRKPGDGDASPSPGSYLHLFRALEPVSYYFKGPEDVIFLIALNEEVAAELSVSLPSVADAVWTDGIASSANNGFVPTKPKTNWPGRLSLSVTVSGRDLREGAKDVLAEAEKYLQEFVEGGDEFEDVVGGNNCSAPTCMDPCGLSLPEGPMRDGEVSSVEDGDLFSALDLQELFSIQYAPPEMSHGPAVLSSEEDREHQPLSANGSARVRDPPQYTRTLLWGSSSVFRSCLSYEQPARNQASATSTPRGPGNLTAEPHGTMAIAGGQTTAPPVQAASCFVQPGVSLCRRSDRHNVLSWLASRVVSFFEEGLGGSCATTFSRLCRGSEGGGVLLAFCLLALLFGDDSFTASPASQDGATRPIAIQDLRCKSRSGYAATLWNEMQRTFLSGILMSRNCLNIWGLIIVDLDLHASTSGASAEVLAAAMRLTDERFGRSFRNARGCGVRECVSSPVQEFLSGYRWSLHPHSAESTATDKVVGTASCSSELLSSDAHVGEVDNRPKNDRATVVSLGVMPAHDERLWNCERTCTTSHHSRCLRESVAGTHAREAATAAPEGATSLGSCVGCTDRQLSDMRDAPFSVEESPCGSREVRGLQRKCPQGQERWRDDKSHLEQTHCETFCCPVIGRHLERLTEALPSLLSLQMRYSGQHPLFLLDDQALRAALAPSSRFVTKCGFAEKRQEVSPPDDSDAFGSTFRTSSKLGLACERVMHY
ncbi:UNVERIFIED_CONTAM: hypothetical protein HHA_203040 [Hammondia hammondi]|eukprot:XP_008884593.1 hypothetical protein HHA_203040 [Hammondia hammondi]